MWKEGKTNPGGVLYSSRVEQALLVRGGWWCLRDLIFKGEEKDAMGWGSLGKKSASHQCSNREPAMKQVDGTRTSSKEKSKRC